jgi:curli biogenesis system outer membrane secretion channel CsgG
MKKLLALVAALVLAATPAAAQQAASAQSQPASPQQSAVQPGMPSIFVSRDEIRQRVAANEAALGNAQVGSQSWWYLVAAIAVGVIIAALVL